ncbi:MAG: YggS family pyridoxal phosphate-dependent enzyme [Candidatus Micrarchaeota archaeon]
MPAPQRPEEIANFFPKHVIRYAEISRLIPNHVQILFACKYAHNEHVADLIRFNELVFGENYLQDALKRWTKVPRERYHFIGHLQSNKVRDAVKLFGTIQTVDSRKLAEKISKVAVEEKLNVDVYIQVNADYNKDQAGVSPKEVGDLVQFVRTLPNIKLIGLMSMGTLGENKKQVFVEVKKLADKYKLKTSMGMSEDYQIAIKEGSDMIRLGRVLL